MGETNPTTFSLSLRYSVTVCTFYKCTGNEDYQKYLFTKHLHLDIGTSEHRIDENGDNIIPDKVL